MNTRKVFLGPKNNHIKEELQSLALGYLKENKGDKFFYVLPNRELLTNHRNAVIDKLGITFDMNIITFDDIVNKILEDRAINLANDPIKRIVIRKILKKLNTKGKLNYYKNFTEYNGFVESCIYIIGSIKRSLITPKEYLLKCPDSSFYKDIGLIYEAYEEELKDKGYLDKDSLYLSSIDLLKNNKNFLHDLDFIIIDEFYDFRPIELEILNLLKNLDINIYINIPYKIANKNKRLNETIISLENLGFQVENIDREKTNQFEALGDILFDSKDSKLDVNIELIKASSPYLEIKKIFKVIKNKCHYDSIDLKDNCICILSNEYEGIIFRVAKEEKVTLSMNEAVPLINLPLTREIITLLELIIYKGKKDIFIDRLKSSYLPICNLKIRDNLEYILRRSKFRDISDLLSKIDKDIVIDINPESINEIKDILLYLKNQSISLQEDKTLKEYSEILSQILGGYHLEDNILNRYKANSNYHILQRDMGNLKRIKDILSAMDATIFAEEKMNLQEYLVVLMDYLKEESIIKTKGNPKGVKLIRIENARGMNYKNVFIPGLMQGIYPKLENNSFFFSDDNYKTLKNIGLDIKDYKNRLDNEILKFTSLISSCKEQLYISCNIGSEGGDKPLYSVFLDGILDKLNGESEEEKVKVTEVSLDYLYKNEVKDISSKKEFTFKLCNDYYNDNLETSLLRHYNSLYDGTLESINLQFEPYTKRSISEFNNYKGLLESDFALNYISNEFSEIKLSVSNLEKHSICPYSFLLSSLFKIEHLERNALDYEPRDNGIIYHEVLRLYYENYKDELINIEVDMSTTYEFLRNILLSQAEKLGYSIKSKAHLLLIEDMYNKLVKFIEEDKKRLTKTNIKPWSFEKWFSINFEINNKKIEIRGIIDRIDKTEDEKYIIIDYKSSDNGKKTIDDINKKISLQLPLYILSQEDKNVVGGFYGTIKESKFHNCIGLLGETSLVKKGQKGAINLDTWNEILTNTKVTMEEIVRGILSGNFSVNPKMCSSYCIYKDICRYDKVQEVEKE